MKIPALFLIRKPILFNEKLDSKINFLSLFESKKKHFDEPALEPNKGDTQIFSIDCELYVRGSKRPLDDDDDNYDPDSSPPAKKNSIPTEMNTLDITPNVCASSRTTGHTPFNKPSPEIPYFNQLVLANLLFDISPKTVNSNILMESNAEMFALELKDRYRVAALLGDILYDVQKMFLDPKLETFISKHVYKIEREIAVQLIYAHNLNIKLSAFLNKTNNVILSDYDLSIPMPNNFDSLNSLCKIISVVNYLRGKNITLVNLTPDLDEEKYLSSLLNILNDGSVSN